MQEEQHTSEKADIDLLIDGAASGSADDFGGLYDMYVERIYRHIYYRVGDKKDAEDLTQQVFLRAWKAIGRYQKTTSPFLAWLMRISQNIVIDHYRKKKNDTYLDDDLFLKDTGASPEQAAEANFDQQQMRKVILRLPGEQQQVIMMSFIEGFSNAEIAAALGKKEGNIRVMVYRALKKMRHMIEAENQRD